MTGDDEQDARLVRSLIDDAMKPQGLDRLGRSRWLHESPDLLWVAEADRGGSWGRWTVQVGAVVKEWSPDLTRPHASDGHLYQADYANLTSAVPPAAMGTRLDDHASYFTAVFDHVASSMSTEERRSALAFMADDIVALFRSISTLDELAASVTNGKVTGFVHRRLRELAPRP